MAMNETASDIVRSGTRSVGPEATAAECARVMLETGNSCVPVVDNDGGLLGILRAESLVASVGETAADCMEAPRAVIPADTPSLEAVRLLRDTDGRCLPVVDDTRLIGLITWDDVRLAFADG